MIKYVGKTHKLISFLLYVSSIVFVVSPMLVAEYFSLEDTSPINIVGISFLFLSVIASFFGGYLFIRIIMFNR